MRHGAARRPWLILGVTAVLAGGFGPGAGVRAEERNQRVPAETASLATAEPWFEEVAATSGIAFLHVRAAATRYWFPEIMSGGGAWLDYDGDGDLDLYLVQGGDLAGEVPPGVGSRLLRNDGDGGFVDVTAAAGAGPGGYGMGAAAGDYDGDGDLDLYVTRVGANALLRNGGDGRFSEQGASAGVADPGWGSSAAFLDYDGDGDLDLFVVNYVHWEADNEIECFTGGRKRDYCHPSQYRAPAADKLFRNEGDGTFTDVSEPAGIWRAFGNGLGVAVGDFNDDGRPDVYVANDGMPNQLWINEGEGRFSDQALLAGCAVSLAGAAQAGMGVQAVDVDEDGRLDIFLTHLRDETNTLYLNRGTWFDDATAASGLAAPSISRTGFGLGFGDFDHDGRLDLYVANGRVGQTQVPLAADPFAEPNQLFRGLGDGRFAEAEPPGGTAAVLIENSRAAAFGDYDGDGDVDLAVVNNGASARLLRNRAGARGHWLQLRLFTGWGEDAVGARVRIGNGHEAQWREVQPAYSYCASNDPKIHFGLGAAERVGQVEIFWPDAARWSLGGLAADRLYVVLRDRGSLSTAAPAAARAHRQPTPRSAPE